MGFIEVKDNFLEKNLINFLYEYFLSLPHFFGHSSKKNSLKFYSHEFNIDNPLINFLSKIIEKDLKISRVYINIQHNYMDGDFHTDDGNITYLIMISKTLDKNSGSFQFIDKENKIQSIDFIQNRMIKFSSFIKHRGLAPTEKNIPRITLAFKTL